MCNMSKKKEADQIEIERGEAQRKASEGFAQRSTKHRHHWPFTLAAAQGDIAIGRCECGEPYKEVK
jgi:hypothetical protein